MRTKFAHLTWADFGECADKRSSAASHLLVHALFDEIQIAIYTRDAARVDRLFIQLAHAAVRQAQVN